MKICPKCGELLMDGTVYCGHCGYKLSEESSNDNDHKENFITSYNNVVNTLSSIDDNQEDQETFIVNNSLELNEKQPLIEDVKEENYEKVNNTSKEEPQNKYKNNKSSLIILSCVLVFCVIMGGIYFFNKKNDSNKIKSSFITTTTKTKNDKKIHITLASVEPAYTVDGEEADIDYSNMKFYWQSDGDNNESREIVESLDNDDFTYSNSTGLKNGDEITVSIEIDEEEYTVTGKKTFKVEFKTESSEEDTSDLTIDERLKDADAYIFENSDSEYLSDSQLKEIKTKEQLRIAINEIYARHGYSFTKNPSIQSYFDGKNWYSKDENLYKDSQMEWNTYEEANLKKLAKMRKGKLKYNPSSAFNI